MRPPLCVLVALVSAMGSFADIKRGRQPLTATFTGSECRRILVNRLILLAMSLPLAAAVATIRLMSSRHLHQVAAS